MRSIRVCCETITQLPFHLCQLRRTIRVKLEILRLSLKKYHNSSSSSLSLTLSLWHLMLSVLNFPGHHQTKTNSKSNTMTKNSKGISAGSGRYKLLISKYYHRKQEEISPGLKLMIDDYSNPTSTVSITFISKNRRSEKTGNNIDVDINIGNEEAKSKRNSNNVTSISNGSQELGLEQEQNRVLPVLDVTDTKEKVFQDEYSNPSSSTSPSVVINEIEIRKAIIQIIGNTRNNQKQYLNRNNLLHRRELEREREREEKRKLKEKEQQLDTQKEIMGSKRTRKRSMGRHKAKVAKRNNQISSLKVQCQEERDSLKHDGELEKQLKPTLLMKNNDILKSSAYNQNTSGELRNNNNHCGGSSLNSKLTCDTITTTPKSVHMSNSFMENTETTINAAAVTVIDKRQALNSKANNHVFNNRIDDINKKNKNKITIMPQETKKMDEKIQQNSIKSVEIVGKTNVDTELCVIDYKKGEKDKKNSKNDRFSSSSSSASKELSPTTPTGCTTINLTKLPSYLKQQPHPQSQPHFRTDGLFLPAESSLHVQHPHPPTYIQHESSLIEPLPVCSDCNTIYATPAAHPPSSSLISTWISPSGIINTTIVPVPPLYDCFSASNPITLYSN